MTDYQKRLRDEAADAYHGKDRGNWGPDFIAGHDFAFERAKVLEEALEVIADVNSAIEYPTRNVSYADWELRRIAREALRVYRSGG